MYSLMKSFGMLATSSSNKLMPVRYVSNEPLWATCEMSNETRGNCTKNFNKFFPLMGIDPSIVHTTKDSSIVLSDDSSMQSRYICASYGAAGFGMLNDHGLKKHGVEKKDYEYSFNVGKGAIFRGFRDFMMENLNLVPKAVSSDPPYVITVSLNSTDDPDRMTSFGAQIRAIQAAIGSDAMKEKVSLRTIIFKEHPLKQQI